MGQEGSEAHDGCKTKRESAVLYLTRHSDRDDKSSSQLAQIHTGGLTYSKVNFKVSWSITASSLG